MPLIPAEGLVLLKGDRVRYTGTQTPALVEKEGTVTVGTRNRTNVDFDDTVLTNTAPHNRNLALRVPRYAPGDRVRITPRGDDSFIKGYADAIGTVSAVEKSIETAAPDDMLGRYELVSVELDVATTHEKLLVFIYNLSMLLPTATLDAPRFEVLDVVRVGTEVCVIRALPKAPGGLYELEDHAGETLHVTAASMEKLT